MDCHGIPGHGPKGRSRQGKSKTQAKRMQREDQSNAMRRENKPSKARNGDCDSARQPKTFRPAPSHVPGPEAHSYFRLFQSDWHFPVQMKEQYLSFASVSESSFVSMPVLYKPTDFSSFKVSLYSRPTAVHLLYLGWSFWIY